MITPMDIHNKQFTKATVRGYSEEEVNDFLNQIVADYERIYREHREMEEKLDQMKAKLANYEKISETMTATLQLAKDTAENVKKNARRNADILIANAKADSEKQIKDAQDYMATLQEQQTDRILIANTRNSTIDALLNQKAQVAKKNNIDIRFKVNDLSGIQVAPIDLVIIIGNLLDNAIEACVKLPAGEREIYAQLLLEDTLFLSFRNTSPPVEIVNSYIATTKKPPDLHGFGLQNVKTALGKYDSFYDMAYEDGYFSFTIEMENDLPSATKKTRFLLHES